jgi:hypothetical protein
MPALILTVFPLAMRGDFFSPAGQNMQGVFAVIPGHLNKLVEELVEGFCPRGGSGEPASRSMPVSPFSWLASYNPPILPPENFSRVRILF